MNARILAFLMALLSAQLALAQAAPVVAPAVPVGSPAEAAAAPTVAPAPSALPADQSQTYRIGPGDQLQVFVWRNPELVATVPVRPDGKISTPLVEDMVAVGKTPVQLARDIEAVLSEYIRSPQVSVIVLSARSIFSEVRVVGEVMKPQAVPYRKGMTVLDVVLAVGGLDEFAAGNRAKIVRSIDGKETDIPVRIEDLVEDGDMKQNIEVMPGDVLVVPQSRW
jgi:polysaccharide biosynthesis/export protein